MYDAYYFKEKIHNIGGFTLIELSIVLVIIGLIVGGVLMGQDLINAARLRTQISQIGKYQTAVNTFKVKYNALPGDLRNTIATQFGMATRSSLPDHGDGNGKIEGGGYNSGTIYPASSTVCGEVSLFWNDLSVARLIDGSFAGVDGNPYSATCGATDPSTVLPIAKIGSGIYITVYGDPATGKNYFHPVAAKLIDGQGRLDNQIPFNGGYAGPAFTPIDAASMDVKLDDGMPLSGLIQARASYSYFIEYDIPTTETPAAPANGICVSNAASNPYNTSLTAGGNVFACSIRIPIN